MALTRQLKRRKLASRCVIISIVSLSLYSCTRLPYANSNEAINAPLSPRADGGGLIYIPDIHPHLSLKKEGAWLIDKTGKLEAAEVLTMPMNWDDRVDFGICDDTVWSLFRIQSQAGGHFLIYSRMHKIDLMECHAFHEDGWIETSRSGQEVPVSERIFTSRRPVFGFTVQAGETITLLISMRGRSSLYRDFTVTDASGFFRRSLFDERFLFFYFGAIVIIILYNICVYMSSKDINYLFYVLYESAMLLYQLSIEGYAALYLWPEWLWFMPRSYNIFISAAFVMCVVFTQSYLDLQKNNPLLYKMGLFLAPLFALTGLLFIFTTASWVVAIGTIFIFSGLFYSFGSSIFVLHKGYRPALIFVVAWSCVIIGAMITTMRRIHWVPDTFLTEYAVYIGNMLEAVLLALALGNRVRLIRKRNQQVEEALEEAHSRIMQDRMKPHFLFNSMNIIFNQLREDPIKAGSTLHRLSDNYHFLTEVTDKPLVALCDEWAFFENYLMLMQERWPDELSLALRFDDRLAALPVPPVFIQPLAENAFKHGMYEESKKELSASCELLGGMVLIRIINNSGKAPFRMDFTRSLGNIRKRLQRYYYDAALDLYQEGAHTVCEIRFSFPGGPVV